MIKLRNAYYCNLKLFLILLVVWGHWMEPEIWSDTDAMNRYRWIYLVHMPLFSFLSGLFLRTPESCLRQLRRTLTTYICAQGFAMVLGAGAVRWDAPYWHLWYLLTLSCWLMLGWVWLRFGRAAWGWVIFVVSLAAGCLAGFVPWIGRTWSLSRTIVFFPWFFLGLLLKPELPWHRLRLPSLVGLGLAVWIVRTETIPVTFLYQASPYHAPGLAFLRLKCDLLALLIGLFLLSWCPRRRFPFTRAGADTMPVYLIHGFVVAVLREFPLGSPLLWSVALIFLVHQLCRWYSVPCGIIPGERRIPHGRISIHLRRTRQSRLPLSAGPDGR